jgi:hypothetical protein
MGFSEGSHEPGVQSAGEDSGDATDPTPTEKFVATALESLRIHCQSWPDRYVEMRVDARTDRRE